MLIALRRYAKSLWSYVRDELMTFAVDRSTQSFFSLQIYNKINWWHCDLFSEFMKLEWPELPELPSGNADDKMINTELCQCVNTDRNIVFTTAPPDACIAR